MFNEFSHHLGIVYHLASRIEEDLFVCKSWVLSCDIARKEIFALE